MTEEANPLRAIVLAAQRPGAINPLAERFGVSHKCLVPMTGRPLIAHVVSMLADHPIVDSIAICVERNAFDSVREAVASISGDARIEWIAAADNLADSVIACGIDHDGPMLITTADHPLLTTESVARIADALDRADAVVAMAPRERVRAAHTDGQRRFYEFRDDGYSNCNLYGLSGHKALRAAEIFRGGGQFAKSAMRIVRAFGLANLIGLRLKLFTLAGATERISRRLQLKLTPLILDDGSQAIDVDNDRTYRIVDEILAARPERKREAA